MAAVPLLLCAALPSAVLTTPDRVCDTAAVLRERLPGGLADVAPLRGCHVCPPGTSVVGGRCMNCTAEVGHGHVGSVIAAVTSWRAPSADCGCEDGWVPVASAGGAEMARVSCVLCYGLWVPGAGCTDCSATGMVWEPPHPSTAGTCTCPAGTESRGGECVDTSAVRAVLLWGDAVTEHADHIVAFPVAYGHMYRDSRFVASRLLPAAARCLSDDPGASRTGSPQRGCSEVASLCALQLGDPTASACYALRRLRSEAAGQSLPSVLRVVVPEDTGEWGEGATVNAPSGTVSITLALWAANGSFMGMQPFGAEIFPCVLSSPSVRWLTSTATQHTLRCSGGPAPVHAASTVIAEPFVTIGREVRPVPVRVGDCGDGAAVHRRFLVSDDVSVPPLRRYLSSVRITSQAMQRTSNGVAVRVSMCVDHQTVGEHEAPRIQVNGAPCSGCNGVYAPSGSIWVREGGGRYVSRLEDGRWVVASRAVSAGDTAESVLLAGGVVGVDPAQIPHAAPQRWWRSAGQPPDDGIVVTAVHPATTNTSATVSSEWLWYDGRQAREAMAGAGAAAAVVGMLLGGLAWVSHGRARMGAPAVQTPARFTVSPLPGCSSDMLRLCGDYVLLLEPERGNAQWRRVGGGADIRLQATSRDGSLHWGFSIDGAVLLRSDRPVAGQGMFPDNVAHFGGWTTGALPALLLVQQPWFAVPSLVSDPGQLLVAVTAFLKGSGQALALATWLACSAVYIEFKHQSAFKRLLPSGLGPFWPAGWVSCAVQLAAMMLTLWEQSRTNVSVIDWEADAAEPEGKPKFWRRATCANRLVQLSCSRSFLTPWAIGWTLLFEEGLSYRILTAADPTATDRWDWDSVPQVNPSGGGLGRSHVASHPVLRVAVSGFIALMSGLVWQSIVMALYVMFESEAGFGLQDPIRRFAALCSDCNVSLLCVPRSPCRSFYLHGQKPVGGGVPPAPMSQVAEAPPPPSGGLVTAEMDRAMLSEQLEQELRGYPLRPWRGVQRRHNGLHWAQTFELLLPPSMEPSVRALRSAPAAIVRATRSGARCYELLQGEKVCGWVPGDARTDAAEEATRVVADALQSSFDWAQPAGMLHSYCGLLPLQMFAFGQPPMAAAGEASSSSMPLQQLQLQLIADGGGPDSVSLAFTTPGWARAVTLLGIERDLFLLEVSVFVWADAALNSVYYAALCAWVVLKLSQVFKTWVGARALSRGLGVDPRLLT
eukprot:TRINITY_DN39252_c0_g1_i1.p1 TRINITY_DN39252_c0_g1~~TRINITY_DN39252_c0_g1_i1.p1  ORF type:complete len:1218 (+),score=334.82 TRINITY_DN39252_c0_g1_i1:70-3723(+)